MQTCGYSASHMQTCGYSAKVICKREYSVNVICKHVDIPPALYSDMWIFRQRYIKTCGYSANVICKHVDIPPALYSDMWIFRQRYMQKFTRLCGVTVLQHLSITMGKIPSGINKIMSTRKPLGVRCDMSAICSHGNRWELYCPQLAYPVSGKQIRKKELLPHTSLSLSLSLHTHTHTGIHSFT